VGSAFINTVVEFALFAACTFMAVKMMIKLMNKAISLRISNVRSPVEGLQSAVDLKKVTSSIDGLKKLID
jgi:large-conductance mechanosensitive channel